MARFEQLVWFAFVGLVATGTVGCVVLQSTHDSVLAELARTAGELETTTGDLAQTTSDLAATKAELAQALAELEMTRAALDAAELNVNELTQSGAACARELDEANSQVSSIEAMLRKRTDEASALLSEVSRLSQIEAETRERNRIYEEVLEKFKSLIDAGQLSVAIERGRLVIKLPQDVLFDTGKAKLRDDGVVTLTLVATVLSTFGGRMFQVEGHTDSVPIDNDKFRNNWELSAARAIAVVTLMTKSGVSPTNLSAAGYGEFQPRAANDTEANKQLNRRIEIVMVPNLDVLSNTVPIK